MPIYLVEEHYVGRPVTVVVADVVHDIEVEASNLREAAELVMGRPRPGRLPDGMRQRQREGAYDHRYIRPDAGRYDGIGGFVVGDPSTLPPAVSHAAAVAAAAAFVDEAGYVDDEGADPDFATYHVLMAMADLAPELELDLSAAMLKEIRRRRPDLRKNDDYAGAVALGFEAQERERSDAPVLRRALDGYAAATGRSGFEDHRTLALDLLRSLADVMHHSDRNLAQLALDVARDRREMMAQEDHGRTSRAFGA